MRMVAAVLKWIVKVMREHKGKSKRMGMVILPCTAGGTIQAFECTKEEPELSSSAKGCLGVINDGAAATLTCELHFKSSWDIHSCTITCIIL